MNLRKRLAALTVCSAFAVAGASHATTVYPGQTLTADYSLSSPPTNYTVFALEVDYNNFVGPLGDYDLSVFDGLGANVFHYEVSPGNGFAQFQVANPITTSDFTVVIANVSSPTNVADIDGFFLNFVDGVPDLFDSTYFNATSFQISGVPAAPEPSIWFLMIAGIGMIGAALRLRSRKELLA